MRAARSNFILLPRFGLRGTDRFHHTHHLEFEMINKFSLYDIVPDIGAVNILDIGAMSLGQGTEPYAPLVNAGHAKVVGFEPDTEECQKLNRNGDGTHTYFPHFIGDGNRATYHRTNHAMTGSLFKPNDPLLEKFQSLLELTRLEGTHEVETRRLDDIDEVRDIDFFKIDVQGAELDVFQNGNRVLAETTLVVTEVEFVALYENQPLFAEIDSCLRTAGFQFHTFLGFGGRCFKPMMLNNNPEQCMRQVLWADAVYVRDFMKLESVATEKLLRLAAMLHDVLDSYDFCHYVLTHIDQRGDWCRPRLI